MILNNLYEITTGFVSRSPLRCYVWAPDKETARIMFAAKYPEVYVTGITIRKLLGATDKQFITNLSDNGWEV